MDYTQLPFSIIAIGDPAYLQRVLQGLAMLTDNGNIGRIAALGLLLGLISIAIKAIITGGEKFEVQHLLTGYILYLVMFIPQVTVRIDPLVIRTDLTGCSVGCDVEGVPIGAAAIGALISQVGYGMARGFEQAFGTSESTGSQLTSGGFGGGLDAIASFRNLDKGVLDVGGDTGKGRGYVAVRKSVERYMHDCTLTRLMQEHGNAEDIFTTQDPVNAIAFNSAWYTTVTYLSVTGEPSPERAVTCREGIIPLNSLMGANSTTGGAGTRLVDLANAALAIRSGQPRIAEQAQDFLEVLTAGTAVDMNKFAFASMAGGLFNQAMVNGPMSSEQTANYMMIHQASAQRATQWAGEETMFRRVITPMISFFEGMLYATMPFSAFLIGFGSAGIALAIKQIQTALWIQLMAPVLAVINLFQVTSMETFARRAANLALQNGGGPLEWTSIASAAQLQAEAVDWLATGSMIAAATPAIALMLLYGGSVAATHLAGRLQGGDVINEKIASPDVLQPGAGVQMGPQSTWDSASGQSKSGSAGLRLSTTMAAAYQQVEAARHSQAVEASQQFTTQLKEAVGKNESFNTAWNKTIGDSLANKTSNLNDIGAKFMQQNGITDEQLASAGMSLNDGIQAMLSATAGIQVAGTGATGSVKESSSSQEQYQKGVALKAQIQQAVSKDESTRFALTKEAADSVQRTLNSSTGLAESVSNAKELSSAASDASRASAAYDQSVQQSQSSNSTFEIDAAQFRQLDPERFAGLREQASNLGLDMAISEGVTHARDVQGIQGTDKQMMAAGLFMAVSGFTPLSKQAHDANPEEMAEFRAKVYEAALPGGGNFYSDGRGIEARYQGYGDTVDSKNITPVGQQLASPELQNLNRAGEAGLRGEVESNLPNPQNLGPQYTTAEQAEAAIDVRKAAQERENAELMAKRDQELEQKSAHIGQAANEIDVRQKNVSSDLTEAVENSGTIQAAKYMATNFISFGPAPEPAGAPGQPSGTDAEPAEATSGRGGR